MTLDFNPYNMRIKKTFGIAMLARCFLFYSLLLSCLLLGQVAGAAPVTGDKLEALDVGETTMENGRAKDATGNERLEWWRQARFGCFVHWGPSAQLGNEWNGRRGGGYAEHIQRVLKISMDDYMKDAIKPFNPTAFNAEEWMDLVERAGMRYFVITAKHHDGFAMYDSKVSDYNIVAQTPWGKDPMAMLKKACDQRNIKFGIYYSHAFDWGDEFAPGNDWEFANPGGDKNLMGGRNWHELHPDKLEDVRKNYVDRKSIPQIQELIANYKPALMWFDTPHKLPNSENERILEAVRKADPKIVINGRLVRPKGDYLNTGDRAVEFPKIEGDWEAIPTTNESYGWNPLDNSHKTPEFLIQVVIKAVSRGGNVLLNIGPTRDGSIDPKDVAILEGIADWMAVNNESIHGCNISPLAPQQWGAVTSKDKTLYLHVFDWPAKALKVGGLLSTPVKAALLTADGQVPLSFNRENDKDVLITLPARELRMVNSVIRLDFDDIPQGDPLQLVDHRESNRLLAFDALRHSGESKLHDASGLRYRDGKIDNYAVYGWTTEDRWLSWEVRLDAPAKFDISIRYGICKGGDYELICNSQSLSATAPSVEGEIPWIADPRTDELGIWDLPEGVHQIRLRVTKANGDDEVFRPLELWLKPRDAEVIQRENRDAV